jgi:predicted esterase
MKNVFVILISALAAPLTVFAGPVLTTQKPVSPEVRDAIAFADCEIANPTFAAYRGWLKYLKFRIAFDSEKFGADSELARADLADLVKWTVAIDADPNVIYRIRGVLEWAYESQADGSGQPFILSVPTDYDPVKSAPLTVEPHGYTNDQRTALAWMKPHTGGFEIAVLGRARGGMYIGLSEADVLDAVKYVRKFWNIDPDRTTITSCSMGGFCSFWLGARHPDMWAGINPGCSYPWPVPVENLLTVPVYSLHSKDDPTVPIVMSHAQVTHLLDIGGKVVYEETNGFGHAVWDFHEGFARSGEWLARQVRPNAKDIRRIDFYAMDATCAKDWWGSVTEWGPLPRPAHFILNAGLDNTLYGRTENVKRLNVDLAHSPFDRSTDLHVSLDGGLSFTIKAPLPETVEFASDATGWAVVDKPVEIPFKLHTTYCSRLVYDGSPILIVYGTKGSSDENTAMRAAAKAASTSANPSWATGLVDPAPDGVSHLCMLYGNLMTKADADVTDRDIARCNLVVIGTAAQNSIAAKISAGLPVKIEKGEIVCDDGRTYVSSGRAFGLVHYNPLSTQKLVLWFASEDARFYRAGAVIPYEMNANGCGVDFLVMDAVDPVVVAARGFDSRWKWTTRDVGSPVLGARAATSDGWAAMFAEALRASVGADFGISASEDPMATGFFERHPGLCAANGLTRVCDMALLYANYHVFTISMNGTELAGLAKALDASAVKRMAFSPNFDAAKLDPARIYTIATIDEGVWSARNLGYIFPPTSKWTGIDASDAVTNFFGEK